MHSMAPRASAPHDDVLWQGFAAGECYGCRCDLTDLGVVQDSDVARS